MTLNLIQLLELELLQRKMKFFTVPIMILWLMIPQEANVILLILCTY